MAGHRRQLGTAARWLMAPTRKSPRQTFKPTWLSPPERQNQILQSPDTLRAMVENIYLRRHD